MNHGYANRAKVRVSRSAARAITKANLMRDGPAMMSSIKSSAKYSCSGSPLKSKIPVGGEIRSSAAPNSLIFRLLEFCGPATDPLTG